MRIQVISACDNDTDVFHIMHFIILNREIDHVACQCEGFACAAMNLEYLAFFYQQIANRGVVVIT